MSKLSIVVSAFNVERFIAQSIQSVLDQTHTDLEVIVVDDASTDSTGQIIDSFDDPRVLAHHLPENIGLGDVLNFGMTQATGDYLMFLDGDDRLSGNTVLAEMARHTKASPDLVRGRMRRWIWDPQGEKPDRFEALTYDKLLPAEAAPVTLRERPAMIHIGSSNQFLINRNWWQGAGITFKLRHFEDGPFVNELMIKARSIVLTDVMLFDYRKITGETGSITSKLLDRDDIELYARHSSLMLGLYAEHFAHDDLLYLLNLQRYVQRLTVGMFRRVRDQRDDGLLSHYLQRVAEVFARFGVDENSIAQFIALPLPGQQKPAFAAERLIDRSYYEVFLFLVRHQCYEAVSYLGNLRRVAILLLARHGGDALWQYHRLINGNTSAEPLPGGRCARVYLHVGSTKTGSTAIQAALLENGAALRERGIFFPEFGIAREDGRESRIAGHRALLREPREFLANVLDCCRPDEAVVLSVEGLSANMKEYPQLWFEVCQLLAAYEVVPVLYLREQSLWIESMWSELVAGTHRRWTGDLADFEAEQDVLELDYDNLYQVLLAPDNVPRVNVVSFDRRVRGPALLPSFMAAIDVTMASLPEALQQSMLDASAASANPGLPAQLAPYVQAMNTTDIPGSVYRGALRIFFNDYVYTGRVSGPAHGLMSVEQREAIQERYRESNATLAARLGIDELFETDDYVPRQAMLEPKVLAYLLESLAAAYQTHARSVPVPAAKARGKGRSGAIRGPRLRRQKVHLLHVRKTGGTALRTALEDHTVTARYRLLLHSHGKTIRDIPQGEKFVFFLRDPVMRFCSGFYSRQRKGAPRHYSDWRPMEARLFERFQTPNELACALANNERHAITGMSAVYHFKPYSNWYGDLDYFRSRLDDLLFVGYQESLEQDYAALRELLGVPPVARLPEDEVESHRTPLEKDYHISEPGLAALQRWYAQDYVFLALCRSLPAGIRS